MLKPVLLSFPCLVLACGIVDAQPLFPNPVYPVGPDVAGIAKADFTGDGLADLIVANYRQESPAGDLSLLAGRGDGTFAEQVRIPLTQHPLGGVETADFDGDGKPDLLVKYYGSAAIMAGNGDGTFGAEAPLTAAFDIISAQVANFNNDGVPDIMVNGTYGQVQLQALLGDGRGSFIQGSPIQPGALVGYVATDVNGDDRDDIVTINDSFRSCDTNPPEKQWNNIRIFLGRGDGGFDQGGYFTTGEWTQSVQALDLDLDGKKDLVLGQIFFQGCSGISGGRATYYGNGNGTFTAGPIETGEFTGWIVPAEVNGDGMLDYLDTRFAVTAFLYQGGRTWTQAQTLYLGADPDITIPGDYNGDGKTDIAVLSGWSQAVHIVNGNGDGTFGPAIIPTLRFAGTSNAGAADFNNDGALDVAATGTDTGDVGVALGNGDGTFGTEGRYPVGVGPYQMTTADLNNDGNRDIVAALFNYHTNIPEVYPNGSLSVLLGHGDGTFDAPVEYESGKNPLAIAVADFDENGTADVVLANWGDGYTIPGDLSLFLGQGNGTMAPQVRIPVDSRWDYYYGWTTPVALGVGDFDGDGHRDLVVGMRGYWGGPDGDIQILFGTGQGTFGTPQVVVFTGSSEGVAVGDLNHDGLDDIVVADAGAQVSWAPGGLRVLIGHGDGTFMASSLLPSGIGPYDVKIDDYNLDGIPDLAISTNGGYLVLLAGAGDGTFGDRLNFGLVGLPLAFVKGDFDGDGQPDLMVMSQGGAYIMRNAAVRPLSIDVSLSSGSKGSGRVTWTTSAEWDLEGFNIVVIDQRGRRQLNTARISCEECVTGAGHTYIFDIPKHKSGRDIYVEAVRPGGRIETFGPARRN